MKKHLLIGCIIMVYSTVIVGQNLKKEALEAKDDRYECFVQLTDSSIIKYNKLKYKTPPMTYGNLYGDGEKLKFKPEDIIAYQTDKGYFIRVSEPSIKGVIGHMGFEYYFAERVRKGKIELFFQFVSNALSVSDRDYTSGLNYYIRKGTWITGVNKATLKLAIKDKKQLLNNFDNMFDKGAIGDIIDIVDAYNQ